MLHFYNQKIYITIWLIILINFCFHQCLTYTDMTDGNDKTSISSLSVIGGILTQTLEDGNYIFLNTQQIIKKKIKI